MKRLVLTFDDGPASIYTRELLDLFAAEKIKSTFFVVAGNAVQHPEIITRMKKEGHGIALHSLEHRNALFCSYRYMKHDFFKSMELMKELNCKITYFRPPWGMRNIFTGSFVKRYHLQMVLWDVMVGDWKAGLTPQILADRIMKKVFDGAVICLHDGCEKYGGAKGAPSNTIGALKIVIPKLKEEGYTFVTVEEFYQHA